MKDVALYGMKTNDEFAFFDEFKIGQNNIPIKYYCTHGGISNLTRIFNYHYEDFIKPKERYDFGDTVNIIIARNMERTQYYSRLHNFERLEPLEASWHHIAYIDKLYWLDSNFMSSLHGVVSVDLAEDMLHSYRISEIAKYVDYWFMSKENPTIIFEPEILKNLKGNLLIHDPLGCEIINKDRRIYVKSAYDPLYKLRNTVGAGDYFAAHTIATKLLYPDMNIELIINESHMRTIHSLRVLNEQI